MNPETLSTIVRVPRAIRFGSFVAFGGPTREAKRAYAWNELVYTDEVSLKHGKIRGVVSRDGNTNIYTGIPYAQAPVGELRWKEPKEELDWQGVKDCTYFGPRCIQGGNPVWLDSAQKSSLNKVISRISNMSRWNVKAKTAST